MKRPAAPSSQQSFLLEALAEFRYSLRSFLRFSEQAVQDRGLQPRQHQLLLQIAGLPAGRKATVGALAERLSLRQNSVVELADRSVAEGLIRRAEDPSDRRRVVLSLTAKGVRVLEMLAASHARELDELAPRLIRALDQIRSARGAAGTAAVARKAPGRVDGRSATAERTSGKSLGASHTPSLRPH